MRHVTLTTSAFAIAAALALPGAAFAEKGGKPNTNGIDHGQGAVHAHQNGTVDPQANRGNDSAPAVDVEDGGEYDEEGEEEGTSEYQQYQDATVEEEGEYDEEGAEQ
jgi:hypothetical protein